MFLHQLATLLRDRPSAVELLCQPAGHLAQRLADFEQRYSPYWDDRGTGDYEGPRRLNTPDKILAGALRANRHLLVTDWSHFLAVEALLQAELGHQTGDGTRLVAYCIQHRVSLVCLSRSARCESAGSFELALSATVVATGQSVRLCAVQLDSPALRHAPR